MERGSVSCRRERIGNRQWFLLYFLFPLLFSFFPFETVNAAIGDHVETIANPGNTTITFFDYFIYDENGNSAADANTTGINEGHSFLFSRDTSAQPDSWNQWTGKKGAATQGIVTGNLVNNYPFLNVGDDPESLSYLFDSDEIYVQTPNGQKPAKVVYSNVDELFTVDDEGHYIFNSDKENAILYWNTIYNDWEFKITEQEKQEDDDLGFFPLSDGNKPTNSNPDGWFFGVHIHNDFSIPYDAKVLNPSGEYQDMVFEFSGDDDVWVYIDGILIGDVGGIHSKESLSINFVTGDVIVKNPKYPSNTTFPTTIYAMVVAAIGEEEARRRFSWKKEESGPYKTFAGSTYHTLDFYYLERGGGNSNMQMRFNLISTYDFTAHKTLRLNKHDDIGHKLEENQFRYRLTGYPITVTNDDGSESVMEPVMPQNRTDRDVYWVPDYDASKTLLEENALANRSGPFIKTLVVGNSLDGNINFGNRDLDSAELAVYTGKKFRYMIEELPPAGAVPYGGTYVYQGGTISPNTDGSYTFAAGEEPIFIDFTGPSKMPPPGAKYQGSYKYGEKIIEPVNGVYTFDGIIYDNTVFYYEGTVGEPPYGWIEKDWYSDENYSVGSAIRFANFDNRYDSIGDAVMEGNKKFLKASGAAITPLIPNQFAFKLTDVTDPDNPVVKQPVIGKPPAENNGSGHFFFDPISYTLADNIPSGETSAVYIYKIEEIPGNDGSIIYSDQAYYARVTLTDPDNNGRLHVDIKYQSEDCYENESCQDTIPSEQVIFTNQRITNLTVDKTVTGNIGSKNKAFTFTLTMPEMHDQTARYSINGTTSYDTVTFDSEGIANFSGGDDFFSLRHENSITFYDIEGPFTVEEASTPEGYFTTWHSSDDPETEIAVQPAAGSITRDNDCAAISYTNTLMGVIPTGIRNDPVPALAGIGAALMLLMTLWIGKSRKDHDQ